MSDILTFRRIPITLVALSAIVLVLVMWIPPEAKLGWTIRVVLLHGALARTGLVLFGAAAVVGVFDLALRRPNLAKWTRTLQFVSLGCWIVYFVSSIASTWLAWGVPFAWGEPRSQASIKILVMAAAFIPLAGWIGKEWFRALLTVVAGPVAIYLVRSASVVQHPVDPVMDANASIYPVLFVLIWVVLLLAAAQLTRLAHAQLNAKARAEENPR